jgi:hypothetical protein
MTQILIDGVTYVSFTNGILRIECGSVNREGKLSPSGTLLIPGVQAGRVLQSIADAAKELGKRARDKAGSAQAGAGKPDVEH